MFYTYKKHMIRVCSVTSAKVLQKPVPKTICICRRMAGRRRGGQGTEKISQDRLEKNCPGQ
jgi:hypothetical protein